MKHTQAPYHEIAKHVAFGIRKGGGIKQLSLEMGTSSHTIGAWLSASKVPTQVEWKRLRQYTADQTLEIKPLCLDMVEIKDGGAYAVIVPEGMAPEMIEGFINDLNSYLDRNKINARIFALPRPVQEMTSDQVAMIEEIWETCPQ